MMNIDFNYRAEDLYQILDKFISQMKPICLDRQISWAKSFYNVRKIHPISLHPVSYAQCH